MVYEAVIDPLDAGLVVSVTVSVALLDVVDAVTPSAVVVTTTRYRSPLSVDFTVAPVVYDDDVAPEMFDHVLVAVDSAFCHWYETVSE